MVKIIETAPGYHDRVRLVGRTEVLLLRFEEEAVTSIQFKRTFLGLEKTSPLHHTPQVEAHAERS
jgi:hypothetical protein